MCFRFVRTASWVTPIGVNPSRVSQRKGAQCGAVRRPVSRLLCEWFNKRDHAFMRVADPQTGKPAIRAWLEVDVADICLKRQQIERPFSGVELQSRDSIGIDAAGPRITV